MNAGIINAILVANVIDYSLCKFNIIITGGPITRGLRVTHCNIHTSIESLNIEAVKIIIYSFQNISLLISSNVTEGAHTST